MLGQGLRVVRATGGDPGGGCRGGTRQYSLSLPPRGGPRRLLCRPPRLALSSSPFTVLCSGHYSCLGFSGLPVPFPEFGEPSLFP